MATEFVAPFESQHMTVAKLESSFRTRSVLFNYQRQKGDSMFKKLKKFVTSFALTAGVCFASALAYAQTELTMYYPVAVGGPLTKIVDGIVGDFMKGNPDIKVSAIYAGNYNDA